MQASGQKWRCTLSFCFFLYSVKTTYLIFVSFVNGLHSKALLVGGHRRMVDGISGQKFRPHAEEKATRPPLYLGH